MPDNVDERDREIWTDCYKLFRQYYKAQNSNETWTKLAQKLMKLQQKYNDHCADAIIMGTNDAILSRMKPAQI